MNYLSFHCYYHHWREIGPRATLLQYLQCELITLYQNNHTILLDPVMYETPSSQTATL